MAPTKRTNIVLKEKYEIAQMYRRGIKVSEIVKQKNIPRTTINGYIKDAENIIKKYESGENSNTMRIRQHKFDNIDSHLLSFFRLARDKKIPISGELLLEKARFYATALQYTDVDKIDRNWIQRWKTRNNILSKRLHGEADSADTAAADDWLTNRLPKLLQDYEPSQILNCDETGLYYRCLPDKTLAFKEEKCSGVKMSKERMTVMLTASMTGEKFPLLVIGKFGNPRCFKGVQSLPIEYKHNKKAWMTSPLFEEYVKKLDKRMKKENRKVALVLDNCTAHPDIKLENVSLVFLPPNVTSKCQPLDAGIIRCLKAKYRSEIAKLRLFAFENDSEFSVDVLQAMRMLKKAWDNVSGKPILLLLELSMYSCVNFR